MTTSSNATKSEALNILLFRGELNEVKPSNSILIPRNQFKWIRNEELKSKSIFIDGDDLVFCSSDESIELLRLNLKQLLMDEYRQVKERAFGIGVDARIELSLCLRNRARELGIRLISKDDWDEIFNVMVRPYRPEQAAQYELDD